MLGGTGIQTIVQQQTTATPAATTVRDRGANVGTSLRRPRQKQATTSMAPISQNDDAEYADGLVTKKYGTHISGCPESSRNSYA